MATKTGTLRVIEPATEQVLAELQEATVEEADQAVARAKAAYPAWKAVSPKDRANLMRRIAATVEKHLEELARLESRNVGKPISDARGEVGMVVDVFNYYAGAPERLAGKTIPVAGGVDMTFREPLGVVALIVPWNFPSPYRVLEGRTGARRRQHNRVEARGPDSPDRRRARPHRARGRSARRVLNVLVGAGRVVGERLVEHPDVAKVAFTGSTEVGKRIGALAAQQIKRVTLELGGKSANIVFADADLDKAAATAPLAVFGNAGQDCCARSRILVERSALDRFMQALERVGQGDPSGDPLARNRDGPLDLSGPAGQGGYVPRAMAPKSRSAAARRKGGLLASADCARARFEHRPRRPRGDLRSDRGGDPVRR